MIPNPIFIYFIEKELQKYTDDPEHYKSYEDWGKELDDEYNRCVDDIHKRGGEQG